ncbi:MAG: right-handed parallel beta-helix repeat-containing protein [Caldilineaceae bacterium]
MSTESASAVSSGKIYYVAPNGDDNNPGTLAAPLGTLQTAIDLVKPGDTVYARAGTYREKIAIRTAGTATLPIHVLAYKEERPIIDGAYELPPTPDAGWTNCADEEDEESCYHYGPLVVIQSQYLTFAGFDIAQSAGRGLLVRDSNHIAIRNNRIHENRYAAVKMVGVSDILFEGNDVWQNGNFAPYDRPPQSPTWPVTINADDADHITYRYNRIYNNWGEGLSTGRLNAHHIRVENNLIFDNYSAQLYIHRSANVTVARNFIYCTNDPTYWRSGKPSPGIAVNNEAQFDEKTDLIVTDADVVNNVVVGCGWNFAIWTTGGSRRLTIAHNTFVNAVSNPGAARTTIAIALLRGDHHNIKFTNNIIYQQDSTIAFVADDPELTLSHNLWSQRPPATAAGDGDIIGDPQLVNPDEPLVPGKVKIAWFKPLATSPALAADMGPQTYIDQKLLDKPLP